MKRLSLTLTGVLLATSALVAPGLAFAQTPAAQAEPEVEELIVLGANIPEPNRESSEVGAFLTVEDLQRTGDPSAAEALTRVTGLTVVEGRFVYVRGLGERYSSALLNGSPLPSPEPLQRVVPLDLFPASVLESVTVQKTYSTNYPGEFGGGVIDLRTIDAPKDPKIRNCRWKIIIRLVSADTPEVDPQVTSRPPMRSDSRLPAQVDAPTCSNTTSTPPLPVARRATVGKFCVL